MKRLRVSHVLVQPVLVWDDGQELTPGPEVEATPLPLSGLPGLIEGLPRQVDELTEKLSG